MAFDPYSFESSALPDGTRLFGFRGREGLSRPYRFDVYVLVTSAADLDLADAVGAKAKLTMNRQDDRTPTSWHGIISSATLVHQNQTFALVRLLVVPQLWLLGQTRHSRVFTKMKVPEIVKAVLDEAGLAEGTDYELRLSRSYEAEEHVCQYQESDLDFVQRWLEFEGIYYFFDHSGDGDLLVITDSSSSHERLDPTPVRYHPVFGDDVTAGPCFDTLSCEHNARPAAVRLSDYDYAHPTLDISGQAEVSATGVGELAVHAGRFFTPARAAHLAKVRAEELAVPAVLHRAGGTVPFQRSGYLTEIEDHPDDTINGEYLIVEAEHYGQNAGGGLGGEATGFAALMELGMPKSPAGKERGDTYRVVVTAIKSSVQFRPRRVTRWPTVWGFETGVIDGPAASEYAQIDDQGRYAVKFHFDESNLKDGKASTFVRMQQPHGGGVEGFHFPLRKGTEVYFTYLGGDPDRPIIAGVLPNAHTPSPVTSQNHTANIIQTGGRNRIEIEDLEGSQRFTMFTPTQNTFLRMGAPNDECNLFLHTDGVGCIHVGTNFEWETGGDKTEIVEGAITETFTGPFETHVPEGDTTEEYKNEKQETIEGALTESNESKMEVEVTLAARETYNEQHTHVTLLRKDTLKSTITQTYTGPHNRTVTGAVTDTYAAGYDLLVTGDQWQTVMGTLNETFGLLEQTNKSWISTTWAAHVGLNLGFGFELLIGIKNENCIAAKIEGAIGVKMELTAAGRYGFHAGAELDKVTASSKTVGGAFRTYGAQIKRKAAIALIVVTLYVSNAAIHIKAP